MAEEDQDEKKPPELRVIEGDDPKRRALERAAKFYDRTKAILDEAGVDVAYVARVLASATLPHSRPDTNFFERSNGNVTLSMVASPKIGLPFGTYPRLLLTWMVTEATLTNSPELELGDSLSAFMRELDLVPTGGRWGSVTRLREQMRRLMSTMISWTATSDTGRVLNNIVPVKRAAFWWDQRRWDQPVLFQSVIRLDQDFFEAATKSPVPVNMDALRVLAHERSPMALDIYTWLTYRMSYLEEPVTIPWRSLQEQFGGDFARTRAFKEKFLERLKLVKQIYPAARVRPSENMRKPGLILEPSPTHVPKIIKPKLRAALPPRAD